MSHEGASRVSDDIGWRFGVSPDGTRDGFNVSAVDAFKGERLQATIRETIQNSLDARATADAQVVVAFTLNELTNLDDAGLRELASYFSAAREVEQTEGGKAFWRRARELIDSGSIDVLGVHDFNTKGLTGPLHDPPGDPQSGAWLALTKGSGLTFKDNDSALGSYGHGSRAPFALSELRTLFYFTRINQQGRLESRFQGRSLLQSVPLMEFSGEEAWSVQTGYYGLKERSAPLVDDEIPAWVRDLRPELDGSSQAIGTSVLIPAPYDASNRDRLWAQIKLATVANFYAAVSSGRLVVRLESETIDAQTIKPTFDTVVDETFLADLEITDTVSGRLESAKTIRRPDKSGSFSVPGMGEIEWFLRLEDVASRGVVGIARGGMLIARGAERLQRFAQMQPFELFISVDSPEGSKFLRQLENPEHTSFSIDRINDPGKKREARKQYNTFVDEVKKLLQTEAGFEAITESTISDLDDFFRAASGAGDPDGEGEPARQLRVVSKSARKHRDNRPVLEAGDGGIGSGRGVAGGEGTRKSRGGNIPGDGPGRARTGLRNGVPVKNLRVVPERGKPGVAVVTFTPLDKLRPKLVLLKSGDRERKRLRFWTEQDKRNGAEARDYIEFTDLDPRARKRLRLHFNPEDLDFPIEGQLEP